MIRRARLSGWAAFASVLVAGTSLGVAYLRDAKSGSAAVRKPSLRVEGAAPSASSRRSAAESTELAESLCDTLHALPGRRRAECCSAPPTQYLHAECVRWLDRALQVGAVELDENDVANCRQAMSRELQGCDWVRPTQPLAPAACRGLLRGRLPAGAECHSSAECQDDLHCAGASANGQGRCVGAEASGATCGRGVDPLSAYMLDPTVDSAHPECAQFCSLLTHRCEALPPLGAACHASVNCAPGHSCINGVCAAAESAPSLAATGDLCRSDFECARGGCVREAGAETGVCGRRCAATLLP